MRPDQIALQLYTVRAAAERDFPATLAAVAEMGYTAVETAGLYGHSAAEVRAALDAHGLRAAAAHVALAQLESDPAGTITDMHTLGCPRLVVPWVPDEKRASAAQVRELADTLNGWGRRLGDAGIALSYHHHDFEFAPLEGSSMWDILTSACDPALVGLEIDVFWAARGGHDPAALIARHAGQVATIHLKDLDQASGADLPAGAGALDWPAILAAARAAGVAWYIVEQDNPRSPLDDVRSARSAMLALASDAA